MHAYDHVWVKSSIIYKPAHKREFSEVEKHQAGLSKQIVSCSII